MTSISQMADFQNQIVALEQTIAQLEIKKQKTLLNEGLSHHIKCMMVDDLIHQQEQLLKLIDNKIIKEKEKHHAVR